MHTLITTNDRMLPFHFSNHKFWKLAVVLLAKGRDQDQCRRRRMVCKAFKVEFLWSLFKSSFASSYFLPPLTLLLIHSTHIILVCIMYLYYIPLDKLKFIFCVKKYWAGCYSILTTAPVLQKQASCFENEITACWYSSMNFF